MKIITRGLLGTIAQVILGGLGADGDTTPVTTALSVSPGRLTLSLAQTVTWYGTGTTWLSSAPTFSHTGISVSVGTVTVDSDTQAHATVTTGGTPGTVIWTDSTTGQTTSQTVANKKPGLVFRRFR